eukprot:5742055-Heterocapsa_arctica.AAC.1
MVVLAEAGERPFRVAASPKPDEPEVPLGRGRSPVIKDSGLGVIELEDCVDEVGDADEVTGEEPEA